MLVELTMFEMSSDLLELQLSRSPTQMLSIHVRYQVSLESRHRTSIASPDLVTTAPSVAPTGNKSEHPITEIYKQPYVMHNVTRTMYSVKNGVA